jgi:hypothetical protein
VLLRGDTPSISRAVIIGNIIIENKSYHLVFLLSFRMPLVTVKLSPVIDVNEQQQNQTDY